MERLIPVFNQSFQDNNPALLHSPQYRRDLLDLKKRYETYHRQLYTSADSLQFVNNEAVIQALSGDFTKSYRLMESLNLGTDENRFRYHRGLIRLLTKHYPAARLDFQDNKESKYATLNTLVAYGREGRTSDGLTYAATTPHGATAGKWNYNTALLYKALGQPEEAVNELAAAIRQKDELIAYRLQRGDLLMKLGKDKKAVDDFEKVARRHPKAQIRYAFALLSLERFAAARYVFDQYLETGDRAFRGDAYLGIGHALYGLRQLSEAQRYYRIAATFRKGDPVALCGQGNVLLTKRDYRAAKVLFDRILRDYPTYLPAYLGRAVAYYGQQKYPETLADFSKAERLLDENKHSLADVFVCKGYAEYYLKKTSAAQADFQRAIRLDAGRYEALAGMSGILIDQKKYPEAGQYLAKALNYEKNYDRMWSNYGNLQLHFDMYKKAYESFRRARLLNPANIKAQNGWGVVLLESDQLDRSLSLFDSLVQANPTIPYLLNNRGIVQAYHGNRHEQRQQYQEASSRYEAAFNDFKAGMAAAPARRFYNVNQGNVYRYWEKYDDARMSYQAYQDKSAINNTAVMYAGQERIKDAKYYLGVALQIDSTHRVFQFNMNLLVKDKHKELARAVASARDDGPFSDIGIKYSRDGFVTIYLYDYEYDTLQFPGRHYLPLPVEEYGEDYFIPEYDFQLLPYEAKKGPTPKKKRGTYKQQKITMPGRSRRVGTQCPDLF
ncbi:hypothetical protein GCM10027275_14100 [Rhabdobacter roseus]|uniref:Tetratricopeptide (TPR) repeat protein n=1 Tax=Rhabdobacter roseus TaxID=1655419 RepID=A0A840TUG9_9BACT|nr:tetratricopeptide repeat protein [Rhabdobacter roseus]MBB5283329.1 tetratricopeptide (TPR) repeat protein [Rhabdobacter roseus]